LPPSCPITNRIRKRSMARCYNCRGKHVVAECPRPMVRCNRCFRYRHKTEECPRLKMAGN
jgi:hypothetical protein